jgi:hypothetical protein
MLAAVRNNEGMNSSSNLTATGTRLKQCRDAKTDAPTVQAAGPGCHLVVKPPVVAAEESRGEAPARPAGQRARPGRA